MRANTRTLGLMFVITFANPKGGSGKTTSAMLLAEQVSLSGGRVAVLDPDANIFGWFNMRRSEGRSTSFGVHARPQAEDTVALIDSLDGSADYLVIDLEGSKDQIVTYALSRTDLCLVPMDGSPMEARQAAQAVRLIETTGNMIRTRIPYALLFTRTNAAFQTTDERDVRNEMEQNNISTLPVRIAKRAPYARIFRDNLLLSELPAIIEAETDSKSASVTDKAIKQVISAIENAAYRRFNDEVEISAHLASKSLQRHAGPDCHDDQRPSLPHGCDQGAGADCDQQGGYQAEHRHYHSGLWHSALRRSGG